MGEARAVLNVNPGKAIEFQLALADHDADLSKAYLADIQSTRAMQVAALGQEDIFSERFLYYFGAGWSLFAMVNFCAVTFVEIPARGQRSRYHS